MLVSRDVITSVGTFRDDLFHSFADYEFCIRVRAAQRRIEVLPTVLVDHHYGEPEEKVALNRRSLRVGYPSWKYYYHVRNGLFTWLRTARDPIAAGLFLARELRSVVGELAYGEQFITRQAMRLRGLSDGVRGRLGRTVLPPRPDTAAPFS